MKIQDLINYRQKTVQLKVGVIIHKRKQRRSSPPVNLSSLVITSMMAISWAAELMAVVGEHPMPVGSGPGLPSFCLSHPLVPSQIPVDRHSTYSFIR